MICSLSGQTRVDTELSLVIDSSASIDQGEYRLQMEGYIRAFQDSAVRDAILSGPFGSISVNVVHFASDAQVAIGNTLLDSFDAIDQFIDQLQFLRSNRILSGVTDIGAGIRQAQGLLVNNSDFIGSRLVMDVSGDGESNSGINVQSARNNALNFGVSTINGLPIDLTTDGALASYYRDLVIGGREPFIEVANSFEAFEEAVTNKIFREIQTCAEAQVLDISFQLIDFGFDTPAGVHLRFTAARGTEYVVQKSIDGINWFDLDGLNHSTGTRERLVIDQNFTEVEALYRVTIDSVVSAPVTISRHAGIGNDRFVNMGITAHEPIAGKGVVTGVEGDTLTANRCDFLRVMATAEGYLLEVETGSLQGFVGMIVGRSQDGKSLTIESDLEVAGLAAGDRFRIRKASTLNSLFGELNQSGFAITQFKTIDGRQELVEGDRVFVPKTGGGFDIYTYFIRDSRRQGWTRKPQQFFGSFDGDDPLIYTRGVILQRASASPPEIMQIGHVLTDQIRVPLVDGLNHVATPFAGVNTLGSTRIGESISSSGASGAADLLLLNFDGYVNGNDSEYAHYWRFRGFFSPNTEWVTGRVFGQTDPFATVDPLSVEVPSAFWMRNRRSSESLLLFPPGF